jgi:hypothetical protein
LVEYELPDKGVDYLPNVKENVVKTTIYVVKILLFICEEFINATK